MKTIRSLFVGVAAAFGATTALAQSSAADLFASVGAPSGLFGAPLLGLRDITPTPSLQGELSVADLATPGDGLLTVDASSELAWLDLTPTRGLPVEQAATSGWLTQGFRFATASELQALVSHGLAQKSFVDWMGGVPAPAELTALTGGPTTLLVGALGGERLPDGQVRVETIMLTRDTRFPDQVFSVYAGALGSNFAGVDAGRLLTDNLQALMAYRNAMPEPSDASVPAAVLGGANLGDFLRSQTAWQAGAIANPDVGVFLVKEMAAVPEPQVFLLMGLGLVGVFAAAWRRSGRQ